ncbi:MAG: AsmA-like C-terminal region-containing protein [Bacteroides sp.]|nr:AsmA-like C-terminal region-containing protein [Bacteroides sp.]
MCASGKGNVIVKVLKILGWTLLTVTVVAGVLFFCAVKFLESKDFSPMVERVAGNYINGKLKVGSLKLGFRPRFPILGVEVKDLSVISAALDSLTEKERGMLPNYADSLLTLDYMAGALDIKRLLVDNELALHDVVFGGLSVNLVIAHNGKANYEVVKIPSDTVKSTKKKKIGGFQIDRFALERPKEIRFYNAADSTAASVLLLTDAMVDGNNMPAYRLKINGNVTSPKATLITNLDSINFGFNGKVYWNPDHPGLVAMEKMEIQGAFLKAIVTGEIDLGDSPIVRKGVVELVPVAIADLLTLMPDSIRRVHHLHDPYFSTNAKIGGRFELTKPMDLTTDTLPTAEIKVYIPSSNLRYGQAKIEQLELDVTVNTLTNKPDSTVIDISRCILSSATTRLKASAVLSTLFSDPSFDADLEGEIDLAQLPPIILEKIPGYLAGVISTDLHARGKGSMFKQEHFHRLAADGFLTARDVYFLSADTNKMVEVRNAKISFDSKQIGEPAPLLKTKLEVDTANLLIGGVDIALDSLTFGGGVVKNGGRHIDTTLMMPVGGELNVRRLNIISITDSAGGRIQNLGGHVMLRKVKNDGSMPEILADLQTGHVSAGSLSDRILLNDAKIKAVMHKLPSDSGKQTVPKSVAPIDIDKEYAYIPPEEVFKLAYAKRHHKPGEKRKRRVYGALTADDNEVLEWDLAKGFNKFLNQWNLKGSVTTDHAQLLTPIFPLRNHFSRLDVRFNNDTVDISNIALRVGKSDIAISGLVTNVRRALTSKTHDTLKVNFSFLSDTIDINELSAGAFTGASYAHRHRGKPNVMKTDNDEALRLRLDALAKEGAKSAVPLLIPVNIDAKLNIAAKNVLYSDLVMHDMGGELLVYDGGVNLHQINATSDAGKLTVSALYSAPKPENMLFGFGMELSDFNIAKFLKLVPAVDSIMPLIHDFSGTISADIAATCRIDSGMNLNLPTLDAAIRISGDNLAFIDPQKYRTLGKWLGFKNKADNTIRHMNVEMTVADGLMRVYPFAFNIDRYRLGIYGSNDMAMNFDYHISVLKSPLPFKFGITISGAPKKYKVRFGGAKFKEDTAIQNVNVVNEARINLVDQIENVFKRGVQNSRFAKLQISQPADYDVLSDPGLSAADSLQLIKEGVIGASVPPKVSEEEKKSEEKPKKKRKKFLFF